MSEITIPGSVTDIEPLAFDGCENIEDVTFLTEKPFAIDLSCFSCQDNATLHVLKKQVPTFSELEGWEDFSKIVGVSDPDDDDIASKMDTNDDGDVNSADVVRIYNYIITGE